MPIEPKIKIEPKYRLSLFGHRKTKPQYLYILKISSDNDSRDNSIRNVSRVWNRAVPCGQMD